MLGRPWAGADSWPCRPRAPLTRRRHSSAGLRPRRRMPSYCLCNASLAFLFVPRQPNGFANQRNGAGPGGSLAPCLSLAFSTSAGSPMPNGSTIPSDGGGSRRGPRPSPVHLLSAATPLHGRPGSNAMGYCLAGAKEMGRVPAGPSPLACAALLQNPRTQWVIAELVRGNGAGPGGPLAPCLCSASAEPPNAVGYC